MFGAQVFKPEYKCEDIKGFCNDTDYKCKQGYTCSDEQRCKKNDTCSTDNNCTENELCVDGKCYTKSGDSYGGAKKKNLRRTEKKVKLSKGTRCVYVGSRGGEYVKINGEFVPLKKAMKGSK